jgi:predicted alpha/beta-fold hydrolase
MSLFQPIPFLSNPHVQTVLGNLLTGRPRRARSVKRAVALPDGDLIVLHETPPRHASPLLPGEGPGVREIFPVALLVHGLGGCHRSGYMQRTAQRLNALGWRVFRMDLRAAGAGLRFARRFYNAACSADVGAIVDHLTGAFPQAPLAVVGFSLGGNIVLKYAGEIAERGPPTLRAIAALAPPIDLVRCSELMMRQPLYDAFYVHHLTRQVAEHERYFPDVPRANFPRKLILRQFDDLFTAPRWGYADALDYYQKASAFQKIGTIRLPTFILTARDDPFVAVEPFEALTAPASVEVHVSRHGGHMGFLGADGAGGFRWAETRLIHWLTRQISGSAEELVAKRRDG